MIFDTFSLEFVSATSNKKGYLYGTYSEAEDLVSPRRAGVTSTLLRGYPGGRGTL